MTAPDDDDPFKPLSAKTGRPNYSISGRTIATPGIARAAKDRALLANLKKKKALKRLKTKEGDSDG